jgi:hypothetical protein
MMVSRSIMMTERKFPYGETLFALRYIITIYRRSLIKEDCDPVVSEGGTTHSIAAEPAINSR